MKVWYFMGEFLVALIAQLEDDDKRWGDTWIKRPRKGQEDRIIKRINEYYFEYQEKGTPIPWLKVVGEAMIGWIRDNNPELWPE